MLSDLTLAGSCVILAVTVAGALWALREHMHEAGELAEALAEPEDQAAREAARVWPVPPELARHNEPQPAPASRFRAGEIPDGRVAGLHPDLERVPGPDDTGSWQIDAATGAIIAPPHTKYFDWPEMEELFRPVPPAPLNHRET